MDPARARNLILVSWVLAAGGALFAPVLYLGDPTFRQVASLNSLILLSPIAAYAFWALFWGIVGLAKHWKRNVRKVGFLSFRFGTLHDRIDQRLTIFRGVVQVLALFVLAVELALYFAVLFAASYVYGLLGGGIYQFLRHHKAARAK